MKNVFAWLSLLLGLKNCEVTETGKKSNCIITGVKTKKIS